MCFLDTQTRLTFTGRARVTYAAATRYRFLLSERASNFITGDKYRLTDSNRT